VHDALEEEHAIRIEIAIPSLTCTSVARLLETVLESGQSHGDSAATDPESRADNLMIDL
jgi:hypothetical protein